MSDRHLIDRMQALYRCYICIMIQRNIVNLIRLDDISEDCRVCRCILQSSFGSSFLAAFATPFLHLYISLIMPVMYCLQTTTFGWKRQFGLCDMTYCLRHSANFITATATVEAPVGRSHLKIQLPCRAEDSVIRDAVGWPLLLQHLVPWHKPL